MNNQGKSFEQDLRNSVPSEWFVQRLRDSGGWSNGTNTRFSIKNEFDFIIFTGHRLFCLELKSTLGKSLPLGNIKENQVKGLIEANKKAGVVAGLLINFRDLDKTFFFSAVELQHFIETESRKSIPIGHCEEFGVLVPQKKKITRYSYDIKEFVKEV